LTTHSGYVCFLGLLFVGFVVLSVVLNEDGTVDLMGS
jgi:hypothetical protein